MLYTNKKIDLDELERQAQEHARNNQRLKLLRITPEVLADYFTSKTLRIESKLPADIAVIRWHISHDGRYIELMLHSDEFPVVEKAAIVEYIDPRDIIFTRLDDGDQS